MSDVKRLLDEATPLPWTERGAARAKGHWDTLVVLHAVNRLPDYEAAVDALDRCVAAFDVEPIALSDVTVSLNDEGRAAIAAARAALTRLREAVPA